MLNIRHLANTKLGSPAFKMLRKTGGKIFCSRSRRKNGDLLNENLEWETIFLATSPEKMLQSLSGSLLNILWWWPDLWLLDSTIQGTNYYATAPPTIWHNFLIVWLNSLDWLTLGLNFQLFLTKHYCHDLNHLLDGVQLAIGQLHPKPGKDSKHDSHSIYFSIGRFSSGPSNFSSWPVGRIWLQ